MTAREELRQLLRSDGILRATPEQPIVHRSGQGAPWAFYSWNVTLTSRGMELCGRALLDRLATFRSTQLAGFGYTAMPLLTSCVLLGGGRYRALSIRERRKAYLARRRVDGAADRAAPVVVVDDSISSGTSLWRAIEALEGEGFEVEGAVALVRFPYRGGVEWAYGHGYRVETLFDVWDDLEMGTTTSGARYAPPRLTATGAPLPAALPPAVAARRAAEIYLSTGLPPGPPEHLDREYDARGGVFVSFRQREDEHRLARHGFWHFDPEKADPCEDLVSAVVMTVDASRGAVSLANLGALKIAVTFFGPLEKIRPAGLDFDRFGIVVRDTTFGRKLGGALPNTQVFVSEGEQYTHARKRNARLAPNEPHDLFRHEVTKHVEPGETWLPYGRPDGNEVRWSHDDEVGRLLTARARQALASALGADVLDGSPLPASLVTEPVEGVAVSVYRNGLIASRIVLGGDPLDELVCRAARETAAAVSPAIRARLGSASDTAVVVSVLYDREPHGRASHDAIAMKVRRGLDTVIVRQGPRSAWALPGAVPYNNWSKSELVRRLAHRCGAADGAAEWATYRTAPWADGRHGVQRLRFGFPVRHPTGGGPGRYRELVERLGAYIQRGLGGDGMPAYRLDPASGTVARSGTSARLVHGLDALVMAGNCLGRQDWMVAGREGLRRCLDRVGLGRVPGALAVPGQRDSAIGDCILLRAVVNSVTALADHPSVEALAERVASLFHPDGRICDGPVRLGAVHDHDFLPGAALQAACAYERTGRRATTIRDLDAVLRWHEGRFEVLATWGMAGWQPQGWAAAWELDRDDRKAAFVFRCADWALDRQLEKNGAFLEELSPTEPSFNTGFVAEGIAAAWRLALDTSDAARAARYGRSWMRAIEFLETLVIQPEDTFPFAAHDLAVGGVRTSLTRSDVRIDAVSHVLHALVEGIALLGRASRIPPAPEGASAERSTPVGVPRTRRPT